MVLGGGTVLNCSKRGIVWTWGSSSLLTGFVRSGTGWGMDLSENSSIESENFFQTRYSSFQTR